MLLPLASALAANEAEPPATVKPFAWARPGFTWIADDPANATDQDGFTAEARLGADAAMTAFPVSARLELALLPEPTLTDAFVAVSPASWLEVRAGQMKVPTSLQYRASDTRRQLPMDASLIAAAGITREIGVDAALSVPIAGANRGVITSGVYNGEGPNRIQNVNQRFKLVEHVLVTPFGARRAAFEGTGRTLYLGVGGGWIYAYTGDGLGGEESNTFLVELQAAYGPLSLQGEALDEDVVHANAAVEDYHVRGVYGQLGCFVPAPWVRDHVEVVGRVEFVDPNTAFGTGEGEALPTLQATRRITGGVDLYVRPPDPDAPARYHDLKVQAAYSAITALEGDELADDRFTLSGTARF